MWWNQSIFKYEQIRASNIYRGNKYSNTSEQLIKSYHHLFFSNYWHDLFTRIKLQNTLITQTRILLCGQNDHVTFLYTDLQCFQKICKKEKCKPVNLNVIFLIKRCTKKLPTRESCWYLLSSYVTAWITIF